MRKGILFCSLILCFAVALSGCVVRTYKLTRDRVDQDLASGNRGFIKGTAAEPGERKTTRDTQVTEVELHNPFKFFGRKTAQPEVMDPADEIPMIEEFELDGTQESIRNRGFLIESEAPEVEKIVKLQKYTVEKGDTLQKISKKFYGTTRKWSKIFEANRAILSSPDSVYPGQVINVPLGVAASQEGEASPSGIK
ncbi:LysM peptidoglycan-binding domain-containing protein [Candidatus Omnitrophota bacterium]